MAKDSDDERRAKQRAAQKRWAAENRDKLRAACRRWYYRNHPENKAKSRQAQREVRQIPGNRARLAELKRKKNRWRSDKIERENTHKRREAKDLLAGRQRPDTCEICGTTEDRIVYDHDHKRGHFRGWLCNRCNRVLGMVGDDARVLAQMIAYLQRTKVNTSRQLTLPGV